MASFELLPPDAKPFTGSASPLRWSRIAATTGTVRASIGYDLRELGPVPTTAADLVRIAVAALLADRLAARGQGFARTIEITVHVSDRATWQGAAGQILTDVLQWLSGDAWSLIPVAADQTGDKPEAPDEVDAVMLLSGGLDSFCGAVDQLSGPGDHVYLGHNNGTTAIVRAQNAVYDWLHQQGSSSDYLRTAVSHVAPKKEPSSRTRSLLFLALATAAGAARGASTVIVPENGYTSLNLPLTASRGGPLSTRSTHPWTISRVQELFETLGLNVHISNPYVGMTKGQLLATAAGLGHSGFVVAAAGTLSCGKLDGRLYSGGNPNHHCGLCVPCLVRRGSFIAARVADKTIYLCDTLTGNALDELHARRASDISSVMAAILTGIDDNDLLAAGPWPDDYDLDAAEQLAQTGLGELASVPLP